jgi:PAS domain S-box-containing protein
MIDAALAHVGKFDDSDLQERYERLVELSPDGILIHDGERIVMANAAVARLAGASDRNQLIGRPITAFLNPPHLKGVEDRLVANDPTGGSAVVRDTFHRLDGSGVEVEVAAIPFVDQGRLAAHVVIRDITKRLAAQTVARDAEGRLRDAQKMEAIGALAGGVAHEVNNMMVVVLGASDLLLRNATLPAEWAQDLRDIWNAADRAATVTRQLLAFSRRAVHLPHPIDLDTLVRNVEPTVQRLLGDGRQLGLVLGGPLGVMVDGGQIEQVIVNLVLNARDAMPTGGQLTITTSGAVIDKDVRGCAGIPIPAGRYGLMSIRDTGVGIDAANLARLFEPFFTTKPVGEGTGLGLAAVYGIMEQNTAFVAVESTPAQGTTFNLYFPLVPEALPPPSPQGLPAVASEGVRSAATILVIDDERSVLKITGRILEADGFCVRLASNGEDALTSVERDGRPDLVLTDLIMPGMGGVVVARRLAADWPDLPILFVSGYSTDDFRREWGVDSKLFLLQKPFTADELVKKVAAVLRLAGAKGHAPGP